MREWDKEWNRRKAENHSKNLHGGEKVDGLTDRWRGVFFEAGQPRGKLRFNYPITHIVFYRKRV